MFQLDPDTIFELFYSKEYLIFHTILKNYETKQKNQDQSVELCSLNTFNWSKVDHCYS